MVFQTQADWRNFFITCTQINILRVHKRLDKWDHLLGRSQRKSGCGTRASNCTGKKSFSVYSHECTTLFFLVVILIIFRTKRTVLLEVGVWDCVWADIWPQVRRVRAAAWPWMRSVAVRRNYTVRFVVSDHTMLVAFSKDSVAWFCRQSAIETSSNPSIVVGMFSF